MAICHKDIGKCLWAAGRPAMTFHLLHLHTFLSIFPCIASVRRISNGAALHESTTSTRHFPETRLDQQVSKDHANESAKSQVWGGILGDFFCTNSDEDLLGASLALSIFRSFQEARLGFLWSFCPGGILSICVSSNCWYELVWQNRSCCAGGWNRVGWIATPLRQVALYRLEAGPCFDLTVYEKHLDRDQTFNLIK